MAEEVAVWRALEGLAEEVGAHLVGTGEGCRDLYDAIGEPDDLLAEHERLFVGPGPVTCPPYESFWREDVPVDIRRSLMGPCTAELHSLYGELGLTVSTVVGDLPDHVAIELEALAFALSSEATWPVARTLFAGHLRHFVPRLCRALAKESELAYYSRLAGLTAAWLAPLERHLAALSEPAREC